MRVNRQHFLQNGQRSMYKFLNQVQNAKDEQALMRAEDLATQERDREKEERLRLEEEEANKERERCGEAWLGQTT